MEAKEQNEKRAGFQETLIKKVGSPIYIGDRCFIPIIELKSYSKNKKFDTNKLDATVIGCNLGPIAFIVIEGKNEWVLPIKNKEIELTYYLEEVSGLKEKLQETREK